MSWFGFFNQAVLPTLVDVSRFASERGEVAREVHHHMTVLVRAPYWSVTAFVLADLTRFGCSVRFKSFVVFFPADGCRTAFAAVPEFATSVTRASEVLHSDEVFLSPPDKQRFEKGYFNTLHRVGNYVMVHAPFVFVTIVDGYIDVSSGEFQRVH